jgi:hypothetical protein
MAAFATTARTQMQAHQTVSFVKKIYKSSMIYERPPCGHLLLIPIMICQVHARLSCEDGNAYLS